MDKRGQALNRLAEVRRDRGLSQVQLAEMTNRRQTYISDLECGRNQNASWDSVGRICAVLEADPYDVFPLPGLRRGRQR